MNAKLESLAKAKSPAIGDFCGGGKAAKSGRFRSFRVVDPFECSLFQVQKMRNTRNRRSRLELR